MGDRLDLLFYSRWQVVQPLSFVGRVLLVSLMEFNLNEEEVIKSWHYLPQRRC